jgi:hypothetical protein
MMRRAEAAEGRADEVEAWAVETSAWAAEAEVGWYTMRKQLAAAEERTRDAEAAAAGPDRFKPLSIESNDIL